MIEDASAVVCGLLATGCRWGDEGHRPLWQRTIQRLGTWPQIGGVVVAINLRRYPGVLAMYAGGIGALIGGQLSTAASILITPVTNEDRKQVAAFWLAVAGTLDQDLMQRVRQADTGNPTSRFHTPANDHVYEVLAPLLQDQVPDSQEYDTLFNRFEFLVSLAVAQHAGSRGRVPGRWSWRDHGMLTGRSAYELTTEELKQHGDGSALVTSGLVPSAERGLELADLLWSQVRFPF